MGFLGTLSCMYAIEHSFWTALPSPRNGHFAVLSDDTLKRLVWLSQTVD